MGSKREKELFEMVPAHEVLTTFTPLTTFFPTISSVLAQLVRNRTLKLVEPLNIVIMGYLPQPQFTTEATAPNISNVEIRRVTMESHILAAQ